MKIRTNVDKLVRVSVMGEVVSPIVSKSAYKISSDGRPVVLPGVGGITYNVRVGKRTMSSPESASRTRRRMNASRKGRMLH